MLLRVGARCTCAASELSAWKSCRVRTGLFRGDETLKYEKSGHVGSGLYRRLHDTTGSKNWSALPSRHGRDRPHPYRLHRDPIEFHRDRAMPGVSAMCAQNYSLHRYVEEYGWWTRRRPTGSCLRNWSRHTVCSSSLSGPSDAAMKSSRINSALPTIRPQPSA